MTTHTESEPCSGRDSLPRTHHGRLPPCAGAACCAPPDSERFRTIPVPKDDSRQLDLVHRRLSHKLSHPQFFLRGIHCRIDVIPRPPPQVGDQPISRIVLRLLGAGKPVPIACRPTQLLRSGSQGCQSRDRSMSRLFTAGLREPGADSVQCEALLTVGIADLS